MEDSTTTATKPWVRKKLNLHILLFAPLAVSVATLCFWVFWNNPGSRNLVTVQFDRRHPMLPVLLPGGVLHADGRTLTFDVPRVIDEPGNTFAQTLLTLAASRLASTVGTNDAPRIVGTPDLEVRDRFTAGALAGAPWALGLGLLVLGVLSTLEMAQLRPVLIEVAGSGRDLQQWKTFKANVERATEDLKTRLEKLEKRPVPVGITPSEVQAAAKAAAEESAKQLRKEITQAVGSIPRGPSPEDMLQIINPVKAGLEAAIQLSASKLNDELLKVNKSIAGPLKEWNDERTQQKAEIEKFTRQVETARARVSDPHALKGQDLKARLNWAAGFKKLAEVYGIPADLDWDEPFKQAITNLVQDFAHPESLATYITGATGSGKSGCAESLAHFYGCESDGPSSVLRWQVANVSTDERFWFVKGDTKAKFTPSGHVTLAVLEGIERDAPRIVVVDEVNQVADLSAFLSPMKDRVLSKKAGPRTIPIPDYGELPIPSGFRLVLLANPAASDLALAGDVLSDPSLANRFRVIAMPSLSPNGENALFTRCFQNRGEGFGDHWPKLDRKLIPFAVESLKPVLGVFQTVRQLAEMDPSWARVAHGTDTPRRIYQKASKTGGSEQAFRNSLEEDFLQEFMKQVGRIISPETPGFNQYRKSLEALDSELRFTRIKERLSHLC